MPMQAYNTLTPLPVARGTAVALGYFDGVHLGHRAVLQAAVQTAALHGLEAAVFTFSLPHGGAGKGRALLTETEKQRRVAACGIQQYVCPPFSAFCSLTPTQFVDEILVRCFGAAHVLCGDNFTFGTHKSGDVTLLRRLCAARGITVHVVPLTQYAGHPVSSTRLRKALAQGEMELVNAMLGEAYVLDLPVQHGKRIGSTALGFPTINQVYPAAMLIPKSGVYLTQVQQGGVWLPGATGLGTRPTVGGEGITCETFIPGFTGQLYGETVAVRFAAYYKPTLRFNTLAELRAYIQDAADATQRYFAAPPAGCE